MAGNPEGAAGGRWRPFAIFAVFAVVVVGAAIALAPGYWYASLILVGIGLAVTLGSLARMAYRCPKCNHQFEINGVLEFVSPQGTGRDRNGDVYGWQFLRCPSCKRWVQATMVPKER